MSVVVAGAVLGVLAPVGHVDLGRAGQDELHFAGVEDLGQARVEHLVEAAHQRLGLVGDAAVEPPADHALDVVLLVLLGDGHVLAAGFEFAFHQLAADVFGDAKGELQVVRAGAAVEVRVLEPLQRLVELGVERFHVAERHGQPQQRLVKGPREEDVEQVLVHQSQAEDSAAEAEPLVVAVDEHGHGADLHRVRVVGRVLEQTVVRIEQLARHQKEELARRPAVVQAVLAAERQLQFRLLQLLLRRRHDAHEGVLQQMAPPHLHLELVRTLAVALRLELPVKVAQFGLKVALARRRRVAHRVAHLHTAAGDQRRRRVRRRPHASVGDFRRCLQRRHASRRRRRRRRRHHHWRHVRHDLLLKEAQQDRQVQVVAEPIQRRRTLGAHAVHFVAQPPVAAKVGVPLLQDVDDIGLPQEGHHLLVVGRRHHQRRRRRPGSARRRRTAGRRRRNGTVAARRRQKGRSRRQQRWRRRRNHRIDASRRQRRRSAGRCRGSASRSRGSSRVGLVGSFRRRLAQARQARVDVRSALVAVVDEEAPAVLVDAAFPSGRQRSVRLGEQVDQRHQVVVVLVALERRRVAPQFRQQLAHGRAVVVELQRRLLAVQQRVKVGSGHELQRRRAQRKVATAAAAGRRV